MWHRTRLSNQLRSHLRQYFPAALEAFNRRGVGLDSREARAVLAVAADPGAAAKMSASKLAGLLRKSGRQRNIDSWVARLRIIFGRPNLRQQPQVEQAMAAQTRALVLQLDAACRAADDLAEAVTESVTESFSQHPEAKILDSFPGIGPLTGARVLAELGDDRDRFADARGLKSYAGAAPITIASGKSEFVRHRRGEEPAACGRRLGMGLRRPSRPGRQGALRPAAGRRRSPRGGDAQPVQPLPRLPAPLPADWTDLKIEKAFPNYPVTTATTAAA